MSRRPYNIPGDPPRQPPGLFQYKVGPSSSFSPHPSRSSPFWQQDQDDGGWPKQPWGEGKKKDKKDWNKWQDGEWQDGDSKGGDWKAGDWNAEEWNSGDGWHGGDGQWSKGKDRRREKQSSSPASAGDRDWKEDWSISCFSSPKTVFLHTSH